MDNVSTKHSDTPLTSSALLLVFLLSIACQLTDVALGPVKLWELMAISIFPLTIRKIEKRILIFFSAFLMLLILSLMKGFFADIHYQYFSALKSKYVISIVRFIELILCLIVTLTPYNIVRNNKGSVESIIKVFLTFNLYITLFIFILFVSDVLFHTGLVSYGVTHRLRGLYVEGGHMVFLLAH
ncbi:Uncharacterised protein [Shimwellia blattae]|uniref:hypothetical protein n=1 Tax=Shimwellia blattae TaxID=563 RepID=UPI000F7130B7|nr:hypothetical protein [Shimwellia blattae]VEC20300.1 Uncharacterised protein [Shimwellia blattae]